MLHEAVEQHLVLVLGALCVRGQPPGGAQLLTLKDAQGDVGVAYVYSQQHSLLIVRCVQEGVNLG